MSKYFILTLVYFFSSVGNIYVYADIVHLKNGQWIKGEIIEETDKTVKLKIRIGQVTLQRQEIDSIEKKEIDQPTEVELKAEGYKEVSLPKFNLNIDTEFKRLSDGDAILINGTTNLPSKTVLRFTFRTSSQTIAVLKETIEEPTFSTKIGPFGYKRVSPGSYIVEVVFSPELQESERIKEMLGGAKEIIAKASVTVGSPYEAEEKANKRKLELTSQLGGLERLFEELNRKYAAQKRDFNKPAWNTWSTKWQFQLKTIESLNEDYRDKTLVVDFPIQENVIREVIYDLNLLWNRYTAELFKMNNLTFDTPPTNDTRDSELLQKTIQENLKATNEFLMASKE